MEAKRISRREVLRGIGLAGAAVWAAPVLTSRRASASVDRCTKKKAHQLCIGHDCHCYWQDPQCGTCGGILRSYCFTRYSDNQCYCAENLYCSDTHACTSDEDCSDFTLGICIIENGCTGCGGQSSRWGICTSRCCSPLDGPRSERARTPRRLGGTAAGR